jgi:hypothetical protein
MLSQIVSADERLEGIENAKKNASLVHVILYTFSGTMGRISQLTANDDKPVSGFLLDLPIIPLAQPRKKETRESNKQPSYFDPCKNKVVGRGRRKEESENQ